MQTTNYRNFMQQFQAHRDRNRSPNHVASLHFLGPEGPLPYLKEAAADH
jgi:hypothetical protein